MKRITRIEFNLLENSFIIYFKVPDGLHMIEIECGINKSLDEIIEYCLS